MQSEIIYDSAHVTPILWRSGEHDIVHCSCQCNFNANAKIL